MNRKTRQDRLIAAVEAARSCSIGDLARQLDVSEETIRRDIRELEGMGKVHKLHGAVRLPDNAFETPFDARIGEQAGAKMAIAAMAAAMLVDNATLFIDSGTTSLYVARALRRHRQLSVITNAVDVARELSSINNNRVFLAGGQVDHDYRATFCGDACDYLARFTPEVAILSMGAIDPKHGLMDYHAGEAATKRVMVANAARIILVADETKFGRAGLVRTCASSDVQTLVTNAPLSASVAAMFADADILVAVPAL